MVNKNVSKKGEIMMARNPLVWFEIYVDDMPRARKLYETVLGVELAELEVPQESPLEMLIRTCFG
jgi:predicted enzyme related to lactoylglutathione lyase